MLKGHVKTKKATDFTKKKVKVGKTTSKGANNRIQLSSKRVIMPHQGVLTQESTPDEDANISSIVKHFHHHSIPARSQALMDLRKILYSSEQVDKHAAMVFPHVFELVYAEDVETRESLIEFINAIFPISKSQSLVSIISIIVTYICGGLTSLHKGVRRDSLALLLQISRFHPKILFRYSEKLISYVLGLIGDPSHASGQDAFRASQNSSQDKNKKVTKRPSILAMSLNVLEILVNGVLSNVGYSKTISHDEVCSNYCFDALFAGSFKTSSNQIMSTKDNSIESISFLVPLCERLSLIWSGLILQSSVISNKNDMIGGALIPIVNIVRSIGHYVLNKFQASISQGFESLLAVVLSSFPYISTEEEASSNATFLLDLNISISEICCLFYLTKGSSNMGIQGERIVLIASQYLLSCPWLLSSPSSSKLNFSLENIDTISSKYFKCLHLLAIADYSSNIYVEYLTDSVGQNVNFLSDSKCLIFFEILSSIAKFLDMNILEQKPSHPLSSSLTSCMSCISNIVASYDDSIAAESTYLLSDSYCLHIIDLLRKCVEILNKSLKYYLVDVAETNNTRVSYIYSLVLSSCRSFLQRYVPQDLNDHRTQEVSSLCKEIVRIFSPIDGILLFKRLPENIRFLCIDIYSFSSFADKTNGFEYHLMKQMCKCVISNPCEKNELSYVLDSFFRKRERISVKYYMDLFVYCSTQYALNVSNEIIHPFLGNKEGFSVQITKNTSTEDKIFGVLADNTFVDMFVHGMLRISGNEHPWRIIPWVLTSFEAIFSRIESISSPTNSSLNEMRSSIERVLLSNIVLKVCRVIAENMKRVLEHDSIAVLNEKDEENISVLLEKGCGILSKECCSLSEFSKYYIFLDDYAEVFTRKEIRSLDCFSLLFIPELILPGRRVLCVDIFLSNLLSNVEHVDENDELVERMYSSFLSVLRSFFTNCESLQDSTILLLGKLETLSSNRGPRAQRVLYEYKEFLTVHFPKALTK